ncbi:MAG: glycosyltransferase family 4 protein [Thermoplasmatota archaeon]
MNLKIVHVVSYFQPEFGYEEYFSAREQAALGHDVHVITSDRIFPFKNVDKMLSDIGSPFKDRKRPVGTESLEGFTVHRLPTRFEVLFDLINYRGVDEKLREIRPEVVHAHGLWQWGSYVSAKTKEELSFRLIVDEHAYSTTYDQSPTFRNFLLDKEYRLLRAPFARYVLKKADEVVAICQETVDFLNDLYNYPNSHFIPLGVDHRRFSFRKEARDRVRRELGIDPDQYLLVTAGRLDKAKRIEHFIKGFQQMGRKDARLVIVGQGDEDYLKRLKEMAGDGVRFLGFKKADELSDLYCAADLGLWGKASITIREAMGCGLPLVLFNEPNMKDLLKWGNGIYVEPTPEAVAEGVQKLLDDRKKREDMGKKGRKGVEESLSVEVESKALLKLYSSTS